MMHTANITPAPDGASDEPVDPSIAVAERHLLMLARLGEIGMELAEAVSRQVAAQSHLQDVGEKAGVTEIAGGEITLVVKGDFGLVFNRLARAIRMTMVLEMKVCEEIKQLKAGLALERREQAKAAADAAARAELYAQFDREDRVRQVMKQAIKAEITDKGAADSLYDEMTERLDEDEAFEDFGDRPVGEIVALICHAFGLHPDWSRWAAEDWAIEEAQAATPGSPFGEGLIAVRFAEVTGGPPNDPPPISPSS
jgi:hypothetical protein